MNSTEGPADAGDGRSGERRQKDRRKVERRAPLPVWRQPWAFAAYGVVGAFVVFWLLSSGDEPATGPAVADVETRMAGPAIDPAPSLAAAAPVEDAFGAAGFERLLASGEAAVGQRVRTVLHCDPIRSVGMRTSEGVTAKRAIVDNADSANRVPAAECRWGEDATAQEVLLIVPPLLAEQFANVPEVERSFVRRREVRAEVEWIGRSEALALRNVAVLRSIE